ncbi:hypothetical protein [Hansschlegelia zhihuaiae]|uniref:Uncharacterized protein n=1 Tax=Hansschlegelia zhihuaiae TaxID=405005 RepID=A0A4Q0M5K8_9HYPH|nr:hypothetical protein [Hansschlegelia zhihuaiae]RXF68083.1 hypothetical protein EK403_20475 [Hansschlegelia zhihuaiae]
MPPLIVLAAAAAGALFGVKALKREWVRVNARLEEAERAEAAVDRAKRPTLKRDPTSGEWRPE